MVTVISLLAGPKFARSGWRVGEQLQNPWRKLCVLRKLHPQGGSVTRNVSGESLCGSAETIPVPVPCDDDGMFSRASRMEGWTRDETGFPLRCERGCRRL